MGQRLQPEGKCQALWMKQFRMIPDIDQSGGGDDADNPVLIAPLAAKQHLAKLCQPLLNRFHRRPDMELDTSSTRAISIRVRALLARAAAATGMSPPSPMAEIHQCGHMPLQNNPDSLFALAQTGGTHLQGAARQIGLHQSNGILSGSVTVGGRVKHCIGGGAEQALAAVATDRSMTTPVSASTPVNIRAKAGESPPPWRKGSPIQWIS